MAARIYTAILGAALSAAPSMALAQVGDPTLITPEFNALKTPESPAFNVLGISPSAVSRPTSPKQFAFSFLHTLAEENQFLIPNNFAVEANLYWWGSHPDLTFPEYQAGGPRSLYRTLSVSLATADSTITGPNGDKHFRRVGVGVRSNFFGQQDTLKCVRDILLALTPINERLTAFADSVLLENPSILDIPDSLEALREAEFQQLKVENEEKLAEVNREQCTDEIANRKGFVTAVAGAAAFGFLEDPADSGIIPTPTASLNTVALWATPSYLGDAFSGIGIVRAMWDEIEADTSEFALDLGGRVIYSHGRYAASAEAVYRYRDREDDTMNEYRLAAVFDVRVISDVWLTATFGRDFDVKEGSPLIALANLQWGLGKPPPRPSRANTQ
jgi:hypothetical protein